MDSNITLRSNVYINQSAQRDDKRFLQHITDYRVLKKYKDSSIWISKQYVLDDFCSDGDIASRSTQLFS